MRHSGLPDLNCPTCGQPFYLPPSHRRAVNYCSHACARAARPVTPVADRLWARVDRSAGEDACWNWTGAVLKTGYGCIRSNPPMKTLRTHRVAYESANGPIPDGLDVLHSCDNRLCCNPAHLSLGTAKDNSDDKLAKGRGARGVKHGNAKLDADSVAIIRAAHAAGMTGRKIARAFRVSESTVSTIVTGKRW